VARIRVEALAASGDAAGAAAEAAGLLAGHLRAESRGLEYASALLVCAQLTRQAALGASPGGAAAAGLREGLSMLREAESCLLAAARAHGWLGISPLTYEDVRTNARPRGGGPAPLLSALRTPGGGGGGDGGAMADVDDIAAPSPLACLYLEPVRLLGLTRCLLVEALVELWNAPPPPPGSGGAAPGGVEAAAAAGDDGTGAALRAGGDALVRHTADKAEEALATLRHIARPPPPLRAGLLLSLGRARRVLLPSTPVPAEAAPPPPPASPGGAAGAADADAPLHAAHPFALTEAALRGALDVSYARGGHDHALMKAASIELEWDLSK
jgi:hypothetical protein